MPTFTRRLYESLIIDEDTVITVVLIRGNRIRLSADGNLNVRRSEQQPISVEGRERRISDIRIKKQK